MSCQWKNLTTGARICTEPAVYRAKYDDCTACPPPHCLGADLCGAHAATERLRADAVGLIELRLLTGVPTP